MIREKVSDKTTTPKNTTVPPIKTRDVSSSGSVGSKIVTVMCCRSKCVAHDMNAVRGTLLMLRKEIRKAHSTPYPLFLFASPPHPRISHHITMDYPHSSPVSCTIFTNRTLTQPHTNRETTQMTKYNKMWKAVRMCSSPAKREGKELTPFLKTVIVALLGSGGVTFFWNANYGPETQYALDNMLKTIVTAKYDPELPEGMTYIEREQDDKLKADLHENIYHGNGFFMLMGESGSGKTTMMHNLLKKEYEDGVIFVKINSAFL